MENFIEVQTHSKPGIYDGEFCGNTKYLKLRV